MKHILSISLIGTFLLALTVQAAVVGTLDGWAWSSTTGWVSMSGTTGTGDPYGVDIEDDDELHGYAWSNHLGWLKFGDLTDCPDGDCAATLNTATGELEGWARFCGATEGTPSGASFDVTDSGEFFDFTGYLDDDNSRAISFSSDGAEMFIHTKLGTFMIDRFELGTPYDVTTALWVQESDPAAVGMEARIGFKFSPDGSKLFVSDWGSKLHEFILSTPYDVDTAVWDSYEDLSAYTTRFYEFEFINGGSGLVVAADTPDLTVYSLSTPYDVSTISYVTSSDIGISSEIIGLEFSADGSQLFVVANYDTLRSYALATPYDVTTATYIEETTVPTDDFWSLHMHSGGLKATGLVRSGTDRAVTINLGQAWDLVGSTSAPAGDCSATADANAGGWDGWVSLNCSNSGDCATSDYKWEMSSGQITGYAWGGEVVGWLYANSIDSGLVSPTASIGVRTAGSGDALTTGTYQLTPGEDIEIEWDSTEALECLSTSGTNFSTGGLTDGTDDTVGEPAEGTSETYTVLCSSSAGNDSASVVVEHIVSEISIWTEPLITEQSNAVLIYWDVTGHDPVACTVSGPNGFSYSLIAGEETGSVVSDPIEGETTLTVSCAANGINPPVSESVNVRINATNIET